MPLTLVAVCGVLLCLSGCAAQRPPVIYDNPLFVPVANRDFVWEQTVDVVDNYFDISREERVRFVGGIETEGLIESFPQVSATLFEPWHNDSVGFFNRLKATFQSTRRTAMLRVIPADGGYLVDVAVYEELEDVLRPQYSPTSAGTFRNDGSMVRFVEPVGDTPVNLGWIPLGREPLVEQEILAGIYQRLGAGSGPVTALPGLANPEDCLPVGQ